ncbi:hypothetical protein DQ04_04441000 [Trypanosoma grayi]|uniref:hypothetical protein n=1 Tax=Trypanosoma grayi TaxID=71804 RepID=UPI0004F4B8FD|nr:hypothetical protein DQ04_04441000 [Trypanosoma grayi]KEG09918.1 hypothetical protein DQ04_04441000 [Trypanosoma grayi]
MFRVSMPLCATSTRRLGRGAVFLPWNARPWPTYDTHADEWKFLDCALAAVVSMTPAEVSEKSLRLCPRHLLHEIEDPVVTLQRRRRIEAQRTLKQQQQQQQQQQRRKREAATAAAASGARAAFYASNSVGLGERAQSGTPGSAAPATSANVNTVNNRMKSNRHPKNKKSTGTFEAAPSCAPSAGPAAAAAAAALSSASQISSEAAVEDKMMAATRQQRNAKPTTAAVPVRVEKKSSNSSSIGSQLESKMLAGKTVVETVKKKGDGEKHVVEGEALDARKDASTTARQRPKKHKPHRGDGKDGKRRSKPLVSSTDADAVNTVAGGGGAGVTNTDVDAAAGAGAADAGSDARHAKDPTRGGGVLNV